jgi:phospholipid/cholesterol/gamma-HCH transport system substrate-binding protein
VKSEITRNSYMNENEDSSIGIEVGRVERLTIDKEKQTALVELRVRKDIEVYDDARATIKTSGLIGDKFVNIDPGGGGDILKPGGTITETGLPLDIEDLVSKYVFGDVTKSDKQESK